MVSSTGQGSVKRNKTTHNDDILFRVHLNVKDGFCSRYGMKEDRAAKIHHDDVEKHAIKCYPDIKRNYVFVRSDKAGEKDENVIAAAVTWLPTVLKEEEF